MKWKGKLNIIINIIIKIVITLILREGHGICFFEVFNVCLICKSFRLCQCKKNTKWEWEWEAVCQFYVAVMVGWLVLKLWGPTTDFSVKLLLVLLFGVGSDSI